MSMAKPTEKEARNNQTTFTQWLLKHPELEPTSFNDLLNVWKKFKMVEIPKKEQKKEPKKEEPKRGLDWYFNCLEQ